MVDLSHLHPDWQALAMRPVTERLTHLGTVRWIGYPRAHQTLAQLERLLVEEPGKIRPQNLLIVGPSNNGKTMIAEKFRRAHPQCVSDNREHEVMPVLMVQMPAEAAISRLFSAILGALGAPVGLYSRQDVREILTMRLMHTVGVRMLVIDEVHNLLGATARRQRELLNVLRYLGNELRIPIVCLGIRDAYLAIRTDDQLENRFHPLVLPLWEAGEELARLLASFEAVLPLREASHLSTPQTLEHILRRSEGTIGEMATLLARAADFALRNGDEKISEAAITQAEYLPPSVRRRAIERTLR